MLSCYRALDLTDEKAFICGKALSDLGIEVIKAEKPGGDPARQHGPYIGDIPDPERSLSWLAYNTNKKSITLDIEKPEGQGVLKKLAGKVDVVIESFQPGYLDSLGSGYSILHQINPGIILASISGFGQEGPYRTFKAPDIVVRAMGGLIYSVGYEDRPPLTASYQHTYMIGAMYAAVGIQIALFQRSITGEGQWVDASVQQAAVVACSAEMEGPYALNQRILSRRGRARSSVTLKDGSVFYNPLLWSCKDGDIAFNLLLNRTAAKTNKALLECIRADGIDPGLLQHWDWEVNGWQDLTPSQAREVMGILGRFFLNHTKAELLELAVQNRFQLGPCNDAEDVLQHPQLNFRGFWQNIEDSSTGVSLKYPGGGIKTTAGYCGPRQRAPHIGEHNVEIYQGLLGLDAAEIDILQKKKVI